MVRRYIGGHKSLFQARHYEAIAAVLKDAQVGLPDEAIVDALVSLFEEDNPNFDTERFRKATRYQ